LGRTFNSIFSKRTSTLFFNHSRFLSLWSHLEEAPLDSNHATAHAFDQDPSPLKVNLGRGVYKDDNGKDWVLPSVRKAEEIIFQKKNGHSYLPFNGLADFTQASANFAFGKDNQVLKDHKVATVQTVSGTGGLRVGAELLGKFGFNVSGFVYIPQPSYVNHIPIFQNANFKIRYYRYYNTKTNRLDIPGFIEDIQSAPARSVFLLHASGHNPTGLDPTFEEWKQLSDALMEQNSICYFDSAYQGFASGDLEADSAAYKYFVSEGHQIILAQSYAKNFGLYGQRIGALNVVTSSQKETKVVLSQLNQVIRPMYSNPPLHGARIVSTVFNTPELFDQWKADIKVMTDRMRGVRAKLVEKLKDLGSQHDWSHITTQKGMFAYSGLTKKQVQDLRELHVYMNFDGRMSISGVNSKNVDYLAESIHNVTR
jgi:aspartate aminotransferase